MRSSGVSDDFHPGDIAAAQEIKHRHTPRKMRFHTSTNGTDPRMTRIAAVSVVCILIVLFACLSMWLASLGPFVGGPMVIPGRLF